MKLLIAFIIGAAVGFGSAWLVFDWPFESHGLSKGDVETRLLDQERAAGREAESATCSERQATGGRQYRCLVVYTTDGGLISTSFRATVNGDSVTFKSLGFG